MVFASFQNAINRRWEENIGGMRQNAFKPKLARKRKYCIECAKRGFYVKQDYSTGKEQWQYSMYEVEYWKCPLCKKTEKVYAKIRGKGKGGVNSY